MPEPIGRGQRYMPGLDGLRAIAVMAVIAYHLGISWAPGGLLGVGVFFTLSGYLITDLLLNEWRSGGRLQLRDFWLRRARRLLPALFLMLAVVVVWVAVADRSQLSALRGDSVAAVFYVSNWWLVASHVSYFSRFGPPSPLGHLWSLAVEEQFYLLWPWMLWGGLIWLMRGADPASPKARARRWRRRHLALAAMTAALAAASAIEMAVLFHPSLDPTRIYDGTDTRAFSVLAGAALAMIWPSRSLRPQVTAGARRVIDAMGLVGLVGIGLLMWRTTQYSPFLYRGGMVLLSLSTLLVIVAVTHPASRLGRVLGWSPLRWIGVRSYGIYLWHFPIIVLTTPTISSGFDLPRATLQVGATVALAALSWRFVESPIRHGALRRLWAQLRSRQWSIDTVPARIWMACSAVVVAVGLGGMGLAGALPVAPAGTLAAVKSENLKFGPTASGPVRSVPAPPPANTTTAPTVTGAASSGPQSGATADAPPPTTTPTTATSCRSVVHIGDSTSESLISPNYLPNPAQRLPAQYERVGVTNVILEISGARSIVETLPGQENGYEVARGLVSQGYRGCWVIALGTNDAANVAAGSNVGLSARIQRMMSVIGDQPVMWVNVKSLLSSGPYADSSMEQWNQALVAACPHYPNMRVFDWSAMAQPSWFISDGIHYTSAGSAARASAIANALAQAFPAGPAHQSAKQAPSRCVVQ